MESSNRYRPGSRPSRACAARSGKLTFVTLVALLGIAVLIGFVGNAGHVVTTKIGTQNAADSIAFSSAQWMARGMNAITATNHLVGEATALVVVLEGLGGPETDLRMEDYPAQSEVTDSINRSLVDMAIINGLPVYGAQAARRADEAIVRPIVERLVSRKNAKHRAFATIYDSKLVLKKAVARQLIAKFVANFGLFVPPPWGWLSAIPAYALHIKADATLVEVGIEYVILEGMELLVANDVMRTLKVTVLEKNLIPALAAHGDYLAGRPLKGAKKRPAGDSGVVNAAIRDTFDYLEAEYKVDASIYPSALTIPTVAKLRLPIEPEAPPSGKGTVRDEPEWGDDNVEPEKYDDALAEIQDKIADSKEKANNRIKKLRQDIEQLQAWSAEIDELKAEDGVTQDEQLAMQKEQDELAADITAKEKEIKDRQDDLQRINAEEKRLGEAMALLAKTPAGSGNLSARPAHLARDKMNQAEERTTQWVRATYPYVDAFRGPILALFRDQLDESEAEKHYRKWTDRYTLTKAWQFRSGYRFEKKSGSTAKSPAGEWRKDANTEPLQMYMMAATFDKDRPTPPPKPGAKRVAKGDEVWTKDTSAGKQMAEDMFTILCMAHRDIEPLFSPVIYRAASRRGITTFAQAIFYNSNEQQAAQSAGKSKTQPKLGWDTLNWDPGASPPEWGAEPTISSTAKWPWDVFTRDPNMLAKARVRLNWQAKLMPVTKRRLVDAGVARLKVGDVDVATDVGAAAGLYDTMVRH